MFLTKLKITVTVILTVGLAGGGAGVLLRQAGAVEPPGRPVQSQVQQSPQKAVQQKSDLDLLPGTWVPTSAEEGGKKISEEEIKEKGFEMVFTKEKVTFPVKGESQEVAYKLDPAKKPKTIDLTFDDGKTVKGIYQLEEGSLKICVQKEPTGQRPTEFASQQGTTLWLIVLKRK
jgi:uncharacterized protein (TIGR03067 family)